MVYKHSLSHIEQFTILSDKSEESKQPEDTINHSQEKSSLKNEGTEKIDKSQNPNLQIDSQKTFIIINLYIKMSEIHELGNYFSNKEFTSVSNKKNRTKNGNFLVSDSVAIYYDFKCPPSNKACQKGENIGEKLQEDSIQKGVKEGSSLSSQCQKPVDRKQEVVIENEDIWVIILLTFLGTIGGLVFIASVSYCVYLIVLGIRERRQELSLRRRKK